MTIKRVVSLIFFSFALMVSGRVFAQVNLLGGTSADSYGSVLEGRSPPSIIKLDPPEISLLGGVSLFEDSISSVAVSQLDCRPILNHRFGESLQNQHNLKYIRRLCWAAHLEGDSFSVHRLVRYRTIKVTGMLTAATGVASLALSLFALAVAVPIVPMGEPSKESEKSGFEIPALAYAGFVLLANSVVAMTIGFIMLVKGHKGASRQLTLKSKDEIIEKAIEKTRRDASSRVGRMPKLFVTAD